LNRMFDGHRRGRAAPAAWCTLMAVVPTVFRVGPYRFFFFSNEGFEPPHVHVEVADGYAKLWVEPVAFAEAHRLNAKQMRDIRQILRDRRAEILEAWNEHFGHQE